MESIDRAVQKLLIFIGRRDWLIGRDFRDRNVWDFCLFLIPIVGSLLHIFRGNSVFAIPDFLHVLLLRCIQRQAIERTISNYQIRTAK